MYNNIYKNKERKKERKQKTKIKLKKESENVFSDYIYFSTFFLNSFFEEMI